MRADPNVFADFNVFRPVEALASLGVDDRVHVARCDQDVAAEQAIGPDSQRARFVQEQINPAVECAALTDQKPRALNDMNLDMPQRAIRTNIQLGIASEIAGEAAGPYTVPDPHFVPTIVQQNAGIRQVCQRVDVASVVFADTFDKRHDDSISFAWLIVARSSSTVSGSGGNSGTLSVFGLLLGIACYVKIGNLKGNGDLTLDIMVGGDRSQVAIMRLQAQIDTT
jgi:hypothetical protein